MSARTSVKLTIAAISFSLIGCKPSINAEDAVMIGRAACEATLKKLISQSQSGKVFPSPRIAQTDWKAIPDGQDWVVAANDFTYYLSAVVTASGTPSECKLKHVDA